MTPEEQVKIADGLNAFFKGAGLEGWSGEVNEAIADVFASMLSQARKCLNAMHWVPRPTYNPSRTWILVNLTRSAIESMSSGEYRVCQLGVVSKYRTALRFASGGVAPVGVKPCD